LNEAQRFLLDTNVVSEIRRQRPSPPVVAFISAIDPASLFISVITIGELWKGAAMKRRTDPALASRIGAWIDALELAYSDRIIGIDAATARRWGALTAERSRPVIDALIAATALVHDFTLVTRNASDFADVTLRVVNPWAGGPTS
jgi:predicted nucleic acid-binding protein